MSELSSHPEKTNTYSKSKQNFLLLILIAVIYFSFYHFIWAVPLFDLDEGAFSQATREMAYRNDYLMTYLNGNPRYDKPILVYWLQTLSLSIFGVNEFAFRLPSSLASTIWMLVIFDFMRRIASFKHGILAAILLASSLSVTIIGKAATADALLNACIAANMLWLWLYIESKNTKWLYFSAIAMGLGFLAKGPIAVLIPGGVSFLYFVGQGKIKAWFFLLSRWKAWLLFAVIALPWYIAVTIKNGPDFIINFIGDHYLNRADSAKEGHHGKWWYYFVVVIIGTLPATTLLFRSFYFSFKNIKQPIIKWHVIWFVFLFIVFTVVATKLPHYIVYGYTGLYVLLTLTLFQNPSRQKDFWLFFPTLLFFLLLFCLPFILGHIPIKREIELAQINALNFSISYYLMIAIAFIIVLFFALESKIEAPLKLAITSLLFLIVLVYQIAPQVGEIRQAPIKKAGLIAAQYPDIPATMWQVNTPSFSVYAGRVTEKTAPIPGTLVLTKNALLKDFPFAYKVFNNELGYALICLPNEQVSCER